MLFGTIPRCGAVAVETGMRGIAPDLPQWANLVFLVIFFGHLLLLRQQPLQGH